MNRQEIEEKVIDIVIEQLGIDKALITSGASFANDLNADSLDAVEMILEFEEQFNVKIPDEDAEKLTTVGEAIDYIQDHLPK